MLPVDVARSSCDGVVVHYALLFKRVLTTLENLERGHLREFVNSGKLTEFKI